jgi:hypothetical protein
VREVSGANEYPVIEFYAGRFRRPPSVAELTGRAAARDRGRARFAVVGLTYLPDPAGQVVALASQHPQAPAGTDPGPGEGLYTLTQNTTISSVRPEAHRHAGAYGHDRAHQRPPAPTSAHPRVAGTGAVPIAIGAPYCPRTLRPKIARTVFDMSARHLDCSSTTRSRRPADQIDHAQAAPNTCCDCWAV